VLPNFDNDHMWPKYLPAVSIFSAFFCGLMHLFFSYSYVDHTVYNISLTSSNLLMLLICISNMRVLYASFVIHGKTMLFFLIMLWVSFFINIYTSASWINKYFDDSNPKTYYSSVINSERSCGGRRSGCHCNVKVAKWENRKDDYTLSWRIARNNKSACKIQNGLLARVKTKEGFLGYEWILDVEIFDIRIDELLKK